MLTHRYSMHLSPAIAMKCQASVVSWWAHQLQSCCLGQYWKRRAPVNNLRKKKIWEVQQPYNDNRSFLIKVTWKWWFEPILYFTKATNPKRDCAQCGSVQITNFTITCATWTTSCQASVTFDARRTQLLRYLISRQMKSFIRKMARKLHGCQKLEQGQVLCLLFFFLLFSPSLLLMHECG